LRPLLPGLLPLLVAITTPSLLLSVRLLVTLEKFDSTRKLAKETTKPGR